MGAAGSIRILLVEDEALDALVVRRQLLDARDRVHWFELETVRTLALALDRLGKDDVDVVLLDLNLPDSNGIETVERIREQGEWLPIVVLTTVGEEDSAARALETGTQDYLVKGEFGAAVLRRCILHAIERQRIARDRRLLEIRLRQAEERESLGALATGIASSFSELLGTIVGRTDAAQLLLGSSRREECVGEHLRAVHKTAARARELAERLRSFAGELEEEFETLDLARFVLGSSDILDPLASAAVAITYDLRTASPRVTANRPRLLQLLMHLVVNAAQAIGRQPGRIEIAIGEAELDAELLADCRGHPEIPPGRYGFIRVRDDGPPIEPRPHGPLDPFVPARPRDRRFGLAAVLGIVRQHRGAVRAVSDASGTAFTVYLPRAES